MKRVLLVAALAAAAVVTFAGSAGATNECRGLQVCIRVPGPWVVVPTARTVPRPLAEFELSCPQGAIAAGLDAELSVQADRRQLAGHARRSREPRRLDRPRRALLRPLRRRLGGRTRPSGRTSAASRPRAAACASRPPPPASTRPATRRRAASRPCGSQPGRTTTVAQACKAGETARRHDPRGRLLHGPAAGGAPRRLGHRLGARQRQSRRRRPPAPAPRSPGSRTVVQVGALCAGATA